MRKLILMAMIAGLLAPAGLHAQQVYISDGKVILDSTEEAGMPANAATDALKTPSYNAYTNPSNDALGQVNGMDNTPAHPLNAKVYHKLEVSLINSPNMEWADGFNYCKDLDINGSDDWRLPTQRELQLMFIFMPALNDVIVNGDHQFLNVEYWSASEGPVVASAYGAEAWFVNFTNGQTTRGGKSISHRVRCVREL